MFPAAPTTGMAPVDLTVEVFGEIRGIAERLSGVWRPASQGRTFVWRGVTEQGPLDSRLYLAASALDTLGGMARVNTALANAVGLTRPSDAAALAGLLGHLSSRVSGLPEDWLTTSTLDNVCGVVAELVAGLAEIAAREGDADRAAGVPWTAVPRSDALPALDDAVLAALDPAAVEISSLAASEITELSTKFAADADMLQERLGSLSGLASMLGFRVPRTFREADDLLYALPHGPGTMPT